MKQVRGSNGCLFRFKPMKNGGFVLQKRTCFIWCNQTMTEWKRTRISPNLSKLNEVTEKITFKNQDEVDLWVAEVVIDGVAFEIKETP